MNVDLPSKHPVKESHDNASSAFTALVLAFVHTALVLGLNPAMLLGPQPEIDPGINPRTCLLSHRRHSGNFPGPTCSVKGAIYVKNILMTFLLQF